MHQCKVERLELRALPQARLLTRPACADMLQAVYHGVPIVAMSFFGDQPINAQKIISKVCIKPFSTLFTDG